MKILKRILLILLIIILAVAAIWAYQYFHHSDPAKVKTYETTNALITPDRLQISAHRSGSGIMPEETMMAFKHCIESSDFAVDWYEFDLHLTKDNVLVLLHDDELDRTSDSAEVFGEEGVTPSDKTYEELLQLNMGYNFQADDGTYPFKDPTADQLEDLRIATLDQVLDYLSANGDFHFIIEVKDEGQRGMTATDMLYTDLTERGILDKVLFGSFQNDVCAYVDQTYPDLMRCASPSEVVDFVMAYIFNKSDFTAGYEVMNVPFGDIKECKGINMGTAGFINYAHSHDIAVFYWTINDENDMAYLNSMKADCLISDYPDKVYAIKDQR